MKEIILTRSDDFEYVCHDCKQLRLWAKGASFDGCGNCGSMNVVQGKPGTLDKEKELDKGPSDDISG